MKYQKYIAVLILQVFVFLSAQTDTINIVTRNHPPGWISEGKFAGQGFFQKGLEFVKKQMPDYLFLTENMSNERMLLTIKNQKKYCRGGLLKTPENEKLMYFSIPHVIYPALHLYYRQKDAEKFTKCLIGDKISLKKLLADKSLALGLESGRNYDANLNDLLKINANKKNVIYRTSTDSEAMVKMLVAGRFDYLLEYPYTVNYSLKSSGQSIDGLIGCQIAEIETDFIYGYMAAPRNLWGRKVIDDLNNAISKIRRDPDYIKSQEEWLPPESLAKFRKFYHSYFINSK